MEQIIGEDEGFMKDLVNYATNMNAYYRGHYAKRDFNFSTFIASIGLPSVDIFNGTKRWYSMVAKVKNS